MALTVEKEYVELDNIWKILLSGDVDISSSIQLKEDLNLILDEKELSIDLDMSNLSYIDSTGLGVLIGVLKRVKKNENNIFVSNVKSNISKLLRITGLDKIFIIR